MPASRPRMGMLTDRGWVRAHITAQPGRLSSWVGGQQRPRRGDRRGNRGRGHLGVADVGDAPLASRAQLRTARRPVPNDTEVRRAGP
jgi:hypothetical protein